MSFKSTDLDLIDQQLWKFYHNELSETTESLRQLVLDSPTQLSKVTMDFDLTKFDLKFSKEREFQTLAIMSWYLPEEIRILLQLTLSETWRDQSDGVKETLLTSKDYALTWLMRLSPWNESDFFGNILNRHFSRIFNLTEFRRNSKRKVQRYSGYCRGYQDTNRGAPSSLRREHWAKLTLLEEEQKQLEIEIQINLLFQRVEEELDFLRLEREMKLLL